MLNPDLYNRLKDVFGQVYIEKEDIQADIKPTAFPVAGRLFTIPEGGEYGEQYRVRCPFCEDKSHHLYVSHLSYTVLSFAGESLGNVGLLAKCFRRDCLRHQENQIKLDEMIRSAFSGSVELRISEDKPKEERSSDLSNSPTVDGIRTWFPGYIPMNQCTDSRVVEYLSARGITPDIAEQFMLGYGPAHSRSGDPLLGGAPFIMLPVIEQSGLVGVQLRALPQFQTETFPKYYFHSSCKRNFMLYNRAQAAKYKIAVICEGAFDCMKIGGPGLATFGHTPSKLQLQHIELDHREGGIIWVPDTEVKKDSSGKVDLDPPAIARKQCAKWFENQTFPWGTAVVTLPKKDAGEMSRAEIWLTIFRQIKSTVMLDYIQEVIIPEITKET